MCLFFWAGRLFYYFECAIGDQEKQQPCLISTKWSLLHGIYHIILLDIVYCIHKAPCTINQSSTVSFLVSLYPFLEGHHM